MAKSKIITVYTGMHKKHPHWTEFMAGSKDGIHTIEIYSKYDIIIDRKKYANCPLVVEGTVKTTFRHFPIKITIQTCTESKKPHVDTFYYDEEHGWIVQRSATTYRSDGKARGKSRAAGF